MAFSGEEVFREEAMRCNFSAAGTSSTASMRVFPTFFANYEMLIDIAYALVRSSAFTPAALSRGCRLMRVVPISPRMVKSSLFRI